MESPSRRDVLRIGAYLAAGMGLGRGTARVFAEGLQKLLDKQEKILWLHGMSCSGCSVSFLNADQPGPVEILTEIVSLVYHPTISSATGDVAVGVVERTVKSGDYFLVFEGSVPLDMPEACLMQGRPIADSLTGILANAKAIIAAGTCAAFGGIPSAQGNPTGGDSIKAFMDRNRIPTKNRLINCPGCPVHPQSLLGTAAYVIAKGLPKLDANLLTPNMFYGHSVHDECPKFHYWEKRVFAKHFGDEGCLFKLGCLGPLSHGSCPGRQWNGGVNWCVRAGAPCVSCTSEGFAKRKDLPFYRKGEAHHAVAYSERDRQGA
ncbi:MAG: hydrogenase small subunit [Phycisphaerae bacterium]|nr:hydrogenase small subunit [Phycisphaerae bacterium]